MENKIWIDALEFDDYGGWKGDTQFTHLMGSGYLLACQAPGVPVADAQTTVSVPAAGRYRLWARTRNWYYPHSPGSFTAAVDGERGAVLGTAPSYNWLWQIVGDFQLAAGEHTLSLVDLSGYFGRCAALVLTADMDYVPARPVAEFEAERARCKRLSLVPVEQGNFDIIVVGGGPAGIPAALAAARRGARCLVLQNRSLMGGNASDEAGVTFNGAAARQPNAREGGIVEEIIRTAAYHQKGWTDAMERLCAVEENLTILYDLHVIEAEMDAATIAAVVARHTVKGTRHRFTGRIFVDATGDGWLMHQAGAKYRMGREATWQHGEEFAPKRADLNTMSGCILWARFEDTGAPVDYQAPDWVARLPEGQAFGRNIEAIAPIWWLEAPNDLDDLYDSELARDELFRVMLAYFHYLKNLWEDRHTAANYAFTHMPFVDAKRESRRMVGDYLLTQEDCVTGKPFEDVIAYSGWPIDLHHLRGIYSGEEGPFFSNSHVPLVQIPFRCTYSANIDNLFAAGRNISVTHVALGTTRVQSTIGILAQAVGTAAAMCLETGLTPRQLGRQQIHNLQQQLMREDLYLPELKSTDPEDLALGRPATASSASTTETWWPHLGKDGELLPLDRQRATFLARGVDREVPALYLRLCNHNQIPAPVTIHLRQQADPDGYTATEDLRVMMVDVPPGEQWVEYPVEITTGLRYLWLYAEPAQGVSWRMQYNPPLDWTRSERWAANERFPNIRRESHCVALALPQMQTVNCSAGNVTNGRSRPYSAQEYGWVSNPAQALPQWLEVELEAGAVVSRIYLIFDTDTSNPATYRALDRTPSRLVSAYTLEVETDGTWRQVALITDNYLRHRRHTIPACAVTRIRLTVQATGGDASARVFAIRAY